MSRIKVLDDQTINQIAAGEVVERPVSVVKELVDNAIDAGAKKITVSLVNGGKDLIRVADDGTGMLKEEALIALERHATSKIISSDDLNKITTMGFRGEALPAIASVSRFTLKTKAAGQKSAIVVRVDGGKLITATETSGVFGAVVEVANLFFNTPARAKFLKSERTEIAKVKTWLQNISLSYPQIHFQLEIDQEVKLNLPAVKSSRERAKKLFVKADLNLVYDDTQYVVDGSLGHPSNNSANTNNLAIIVNDRVVQDKLILKAIKDGFGIAIKAREFPVGYLKINLPTDELDVNVHPQKAEVRFVHTGKIYSIVKTCVEEALKGFKTPQSSGVQAEVINLKTSANQSVQFIPAVEGQTALSLNKTQIVPQVNSAEQVIEFDSNYSVNETELRFSDLKFIGSIFNCYLLCELDQAMYVVDMHAAHERYNYNLVRNNFNQKTTDSQILLLPVSITLDPESIVNLKSNLKLLEEFGFSIDFSSENTVVVTAIPSILKDKDLKTTIQEFANLESDKELKSSLDQKIDYVAARIACHASIRSGDKLKVSDVYSLFDNLDSAEFSSACPHGRPVIIKFSKTEIEGWFARA